jgi:plasmid stabilization system protein ParE
VSHTILLADEARRQLAALDEWWKMNRQASPNLLVGEFERAIALLAAQPFLGKKSRALGGTHRQLLLRRSRTLLYYRVAEKTSSVLIVALRSAMRGRGPKLQRHDTTSAPKGKLTKPLARRVRSRGRTGKRWQEFSRTGRGSRCRDAHRFAKGASSAARDTGI